MAPTAESPASPPVSTEAARRKEGSFLGKAGPLVLARGITAILTISIPLVLARAMSLEEYGTYKQFFLLATTLFYILPFGIPQALYFFLPRAEQTRPYIGQTLIYLLGIGVLAAAGIWIFAEVIAAQFSNPALAAYKGTLAIYVAGVLGAFPLELALTGQGKTKQSAIVYLVSDTVRALSMVLPVVFGFGVAGALYGIAAFSVARVVVTWIVLVPRGEGPLWDRRLFVSQVIYSAPFGAAIVLAIAQQYAHQFVVSASVSPEAFAIYAVACFQLPLVELFYTPTSEVLMVRLGELEREGRVHEGVEAFREAAAKLSLVFYPMAAFLFAAAPEFIGALFGAKFLPAVPMFRVGVLAVVMAIFPMDGVLRARNETRYLFVSYLVKALVTIPLVWFGVKWFGMAGGMGSWAIAEIVGKAMLLLRIPRALSTEQKKVGFRDVLPLRDLGKALAAAGAAAAAVAVIRFVAPAAWNADLPDGFLWRMMPLVAAAALFGAGYLVALRAVGVNPMRLVASLRRR